MKNPYRKVKDLTFNNFTEQEYHMLVNEPRQHSPTRQNTLWQLTEAIFRKNNQNQNLETDENARQEIETEITSREVKTAI